MSLGRELAPAATIGRPKFRHYPGPATGVILAIPFAALAVFGFTTFRGALSPGFYWFIAACAALLMLLSLVTTVFWLRFGISLGSRARHRDHRAREGARAPLRRHRRDHGSRPAAL
jgi:hypothetical protein